MNCFLLTHTTLWQKGRVNQTIMLHWDYLTFKVKFYNTCIHIDIYTHRNCETDANGVIENVCFFSQYSLYWVMEKVYPCPLPLDSFAAYMSRCTKWILCQHKHVFQSYPCHLSSGDYICFHSFKMLNALLISKCFMCLKINSNLKIQDAIH